MKNCAMITIAGLTMDFIDHGLPPEKAITLLCKAIAAGDIGIVIDHIPAARQPAFRRVFATMIQNEVLRRQCAANAIVEMKRIRATVFEVRIDEGGTAPKTYYLKQENGSWRPVPPERI